MPGWAIYGYAAGVDRYAYYRDALGPYCKPAAYVDLDLFDLNIHAIRRRCSINQRVRIATKSLRCRPALQRILAQDPQFCGLLTYCARETVWLSQSGFDNLLLAYPVVNPVEIRLICQEVQRGKKIICMADLLEHVVLLEREARQVGVSLSLCLDLDLSTEFPGVHFGVYRSSLDSPQSVLNLAERVCASQHLSLAGLMGYEAQIAGVPDEISGQTIKNTVVRWMKRKSLNELRERRERVCQKLREQGYSLEFVNGGGTGSLETTRDDPNITEVTVGSAFFSPHLFDNYRGFHHEPAAGFALEICRRPKPSIFTCLGGGYVASGATGAEKQPIPYLPSGVQLMPLEGAGEVQTPVRYGGGEVKIGDPIFFRHAKAGELCEHFNQLYVVGVGRVLDQWVTYRGEGQCFL